MDAKQLDTAIPAASRDNPSLARVLRHLAERIAALEAKKAPAKRKPREAKA